MKFVPSSQSRLNLLILTLLSFSFTLLLLFLRPKNTNLNNYYSSPTLSPKPTSQPNYIIKSTKADQTISISKTNTKFLLWNNYIFIGTGYYEPQKVYSLNTDTGEIKTIFENNNLRQGISDMSIIENNLFLSIGGYLAGGATYYFELPDFEAKLLSKTANGKIDYIDGNYWLLSGEGDACWSYTTYHHLDLATKKVHPVFTSEDNCQNEGKEIVNFNYQNNLIAADFINVGQEDPEINYQNIYLVSIDNPKNNKTLIDKNRMPPGITKIISQPSDNLLILISNYQNFSFDLTTRILSTFDSKNIPTATPQPTPTIFNSQSIIQRIKTIPSIELTE